MVRNSLKKFAKIEPDINDVVSSDKWLRYRNKFAFPVQEKNGEIKIGMFQKNSHNIIEIDDCLLQSEKTKIILKLFKEYMLENKISAYSDGFFRMNLPGVHFNNSNWKYIIGWIRIWSILMLLVGPIVWFAACYFALNTDLMKVFAASSIVTGVVILLSIFIPIYVVAKKYE